MKSIILALLSTLILASCVTAEKMDGLREGMTKAEVIKRAGSPDGYQRNGEYEVLLYVKRRPGGWSAFTGSAYNLVDYSVIFKDDHVIEYGPGKTYERGGNDLPFVRTPQR
ncbi:MAG: hypothetical protein M3Q16_07440 [Pseudomonadota bacterium]|nr:hypothetical protein [Pseudomonadota bacterium]